MPPRRRTMPTRRTTLQQGEPCQHSGALPRCVFAAKNDGRPLGDSVQFRRRRA